MLAQATIPVSLLDNLLNECSRAFFSQNTAPSRWKQQCDIGEDPNALNHDWYARGIACGDDYVGWNGDPWILRNGSWWTNYMAETTRFGGELATIRQVWKWNGEGEPSHFPSRQKREVDFPITEAMTDLYNYMIGDNAPADLDNLEAALEILLELILIGLPRGASARYAAGLEKYLGRLRAQRAGKYKPKVGEPPVMRRSIKIRGKRVTDTTRRANHRPGRYKGREAKYKVPRGVASTLSYMTESIDLINALFTAAGGKEYRYIGYGNVRRTSHREKAEYVYNHYNEIDIAKAAALIAEEQYDDLQYRALPGVGQGVALTLGKNKEQAKKEAAKLFKDIKPKFDATVQPAIIKCLESVDAILGEVLRALKSLLDPAMKLLAAIRAQILALLGRMAYGNISNASQKAEARLGYIFDHTVKAAEEAGATLLGYITDEIYEPGREVYENVTKHSDYPLPPPAAPDFVPNPY